MIYGKSLNPHLQCTTGLQVHSRNSKV